MVFIVRFKSLLKFEEDFEFDKMLLVTVIVLFDIILCQKRVLMYFESTLLASKAFITTTECRCNNPLNRVAMLISYRPR